MTMRLLLAAAAAATLLSTLAGCAGTAARDDRAAESQRFGFTAGDTLAVVDRVTWGASTSSFDEARGAGIDRWLAEQLHPGEDRLPSVIDARIRDMTISRQPLDSIVLDLEARRKAADMLADPKQKQAAQKAYQDEMNRLLREATSRSLLRDLYSHNQLREQMTWFWVNHFSIHQGKANLRAMVGDYEETAIRPHALGKFRDLLRATVYHPAMLRYLDNEQNAVNHINENYARELMELHTLGVDGGYTQGDVQELARILTGLGVNLGNPPPKVKPDLQAQYVHRGLFEFNPMRHDYRDKIFLGQKIKGRGLAEVDEALDRLCRSPATARFVTRKIALYLTGTDPSPRLAQALANTFTRTDGDIAGVLAALFAAPEFRQSLGHVFKDPVHYVVSAVRIAYDDKTILNTNPMAGWLSRLGESPYNRQTPDGYPLAASAWDSSGQMNARFEIAKAIGSSSAGLFKTDVPQGQDQPAFPQLATPLYYTAMRQTLGPSTRQALAQAISAQEWNVFLLASPEFMQR